METFRAGGNCHRGGLLGCVLRSRAGYRVAGLSVSRAACKIQMYAKLIGRASLPVLYFKALIGCGCLTICNTGGAVVDNWFVNLLFITAAFGAAFLLFRLLMTLCRLFSKLWKKLSAYVFVCVGLSKQARDIVSSTWFFWVLKGKLTIRAVCYLKMISDGTPKEEANTYAMSVDTYLASELKNEAMLIVQNAYGGNRFATISHARLLGFRG